MANPSFSITVDAAPVVEMLGAAAAGLKPVLAEELVSVSELVKQEMRSRVHVGVGGDQGLRGSIGYKIVPEALTSEIKPSLPYGDALETGSRPHWVSAKPGSPLEQWARLKGINPYALQRSIARKGTMPHPYIQPTFVAVAPAVSERFSVAVGKFVEEVDHARV